MSLCLGRESEKASYLLIPEGDGYSLYTYLHFLNAMQEAEQQAWETAYIELNWPGSMRTLGSQIVQRQIDSDVYSANTDEIEETAPWVLQSNVQVESAG